MGETTLIKGADWVVAWDAAAQEHVYLRTADVLFGPEGIVEVGSVDPARAAGAAVVDGRGRMVMPGLVNVHTHPTSEPLLRGINEEKRNPLLFQSGLYDFIFLLRGSDPNDTRTYTDAEGRAAVRLAVWELLKSGCTTFCDYSGPREGWVEEVSALGIRTCIAPAFRSGAWYTENGHEVLYRWAEDGGAAAFRKAMDCLDTVAKSGTDLVFGHVAPAQIDTCTPELLRDAYAEAVRRDQMMQIHAAQSVVEFREMHRRHGMTPLEWLEHVGVLGAKTVISHCIFLDHHSWINLPETKDLDRLAASGASVAHCPYQFARGGILLENFGRYRDRGIEIGIGTDTHPHNFLDEMRWALTLAKVQGRRYDATTVPEVFRAATVGGAHVLGRSDIGRLAPGMKADVVVCDLTHPTVQPLRDPLREVLFSGTDRVVRDVWIGGRQVVRAGEVLTIDIARTIAEVNAGQQRAIPGVPNRDWAGRTVDEIFPLALPVREVGPAARAAE